VSKALPSHINALKIGALKFKRNISQYRNAIARLSLRAKPSRTRRAVMFES
jgi:hypothetical protein